MMNKLYIPQKLCTLNEYIQAERSNRYSAAKIKSELTSLVGWYCKKLGFEINKDKQHDVSIKWTTKDKKPDSDNVFFGVKFILDGLVAVGALRGDGYKYIRNISNVRVIGKIDSVEAEFLEV